MISNGVAGWKASGNAGAEYAIIAVSFQTVSATAIEVMDAGIRKILLENPPGVNCSGN